MKKKVRTQARVTPELRKQIERLIELNQAHLAAVRGDDEAFYMDGRHEELVQLVRVVHPALGISPWDDDDERLEAALQEG